MKRIISLAAVMLILTVSAAPALAMEFTKPVSSYPNTGGYFTWLTQTGGTYHVGMDFPASAGTAVYSIRDGTVRVARTNATGYGRLNPSQPGPTIVIEHKDDNGKAFYALYGHVSFDANKIFVGASVKKGDSIGQIISFYNGNIYCPHLHFGINTVSASTVGNVANRNNTSGFVNPVGFLGSSSVPPVQSSLNVRVADDKNGGGTSREFGVGNYVLSSFGTIKNDSISYIHIPSGLSMVIFIHDNYEGDYRRLGAGTYNLEIVFEGGFNNSISSFMVMNGNEALSWERISPSAEPKANIANGTYYIQGKGSGRNIDVSYGGTANGQSVWIYDANGTTAQQWSFERQANGAYKIKAVHSGKLMEVRNSSLANGADVAQWSEANILTQQWYIYDKGNGWYEFVNANSGKALDVAGNGTANGTNVWQYERNNTDAQRFKLIKHDTNLKIYSIAVANPTVKVGDYCWMTVVTGADINNIWIVNETNGATVYELVRSYPVGNNKGWDIGWQLGRSGYRTGYVVASNGSGTVRMAFNCTALD